MADSKTDYPLHEKMKANKAEHKFLQRFLGWLEDNNLTVCAVRTEDQLEKAMEAVDDGVFYEEYQEEPQPTHPFFLLAEMLMGVMSRSETRMFLEAPYSIDVGIKGKAALIGKYFDIDVQEFDREKDRMLEAWRKDQGL